MRRGAWLWRSISCSAETVARRMSSRLFALASPSCWKQLVSITWTIPMHRCLHACRRGAASNKDRVGYSFAQFVDLDPKLLDLVPNVLYPFYIVLETINLSNGPSHARHLAVCCFFAPVGTPLTRQNRSLNGILNLGLSHFFPTAESSRYANLVDPPLDRPDSILEMIFQVS
jgi:hypothetical protein